MASPIVLPQASARIIDKEDPITGILSGLLTKDWYIALDAITRRVNVAQADGTGGFVEDNTGGTTYTIPNGIDFVLNVLVAPCTVTLPDATVGKGQILFIKNATGLSGAPIGIQTIYAQNMDGAPGLTLQIFQAAILESDGIEWHVISIYNMTTFHVLTTAVNLAVVLGSNYAVMASAGVTITLPDATADLGRLIVVKSTDASTITLTPAGGQTIDGAGSAATTSVIWILSDGTTDWKVVSGSAAGSTPGASSSYSPTVGNVTSPSTTAFSLQWGKYRFVRIQVTGTGQLGLAPTITLPATPVSSAQTLTVDLLDTTSNTQLIGGITISGSTMTVGNGVTYTTHAYQITITGWYETT